MLDSFEFFEFQNFNVHVHVTINTYLLDCTAPELLLVKYMQCQLCIFFYPQYRCISDFNIKQTTTKTTSNIVKILKLSLFSFKKYFVFFFYKCMKKMSLIKSTIPYKLSPIKLFKKL